MRALVLCCAVAASILPAHATVQCTSRPQAEWLASDAIKARAISSGYQISLFKTTKGNCYEIYGKDERGRLVEIYFDPTSGRVVRESAR